MGLDTEARRWERTRWSSARSPCTGRALC